MLVKGHPPADPAVDVARQDGAIDLVIFDCDGVLVDSEPLAMEGLIETVARHGVTLSTRDAYARFLGRSSASEAEVLRADFGVVLSDDDIAAMRQRLQARFRRDLRPIPGVAATVEALGVPVCVASSSRIERIRLSLDLTGLRALFDPHIFSATMVTEGKPAPDLFLLAAGRMGVDPRRCLVIEDSPAGVEAARRAGMTVFGFVGGGHRIAAELENVLGSASPARIFDTMEALPAMMRALPDATPDPS